MSTNISTTDYKKLNIDLLIADISSANNSYYLFVGDNQVYSNTTLQPISPDIYDCYNHPWTNMIFGTMINQSNILPVVQNIQYVANTVYAMYDDQDTNLYTKNFFVTTLEGSFYHIWKILDNNNQSNSVVAPLFSNLSGNNALYQTSDGYRWKYLTSISTTTANTFSTSAYFPLIANTTVSQSAIPGSIDVIVVDTPGQYYNNYINGTLNFSDIKLNGDSTLYNISNPNVISTNSYYSNCIMYITTGVAAGQYSSISSYISNTTGNIVKINTPFSPVPQNGDNFQITPQVLVTSADSEQTINCVGRALVNATNSNSIYRVEMLNIGAGYRNATANVLVNPIVGVTNFASVRPIIPPPGGHGSNCFNELYCNNAVISVSIANTIGGTVPATNQFQQYGVLRNPLFANVGINFSLTNGSFVDNETISLIQPLQLQTNCTTTLGNTIVVGLPNTANFTNQFGPNDPVYLTTPDTSKTQLAFVSSNVNSNAVTLILDRPSTFSCTQTIIWQPRISTNCYVTNVVNSSSITVNSAFGIFGTGSRFIGQTSGTSGIVSSVSRNNNLKTFNTFVQLYKYNVTLLNGGFIENETVKCTSSNTTAIVHSTDGTSSLILYVSNFQNGEFNTGDQIYGSNSVGLITGKAIGELVYQSGDILYLENINPVPRNPDQTETLNIVLNF